MRIIRPSALLLLCAALAAPLIGSAAGRGLGHDRVRPPHPSHPPGPVRPPVPNPGPLVLPPPTCTSITSSGEIMTATLSAPLPGTVLSAYEPDCISNIDVLGTGSVGLTLSDLYFIIDSSGSTGACSGFDVDQDGVIGMPAGPAGCTDPDDNVLAAEVRAVHDFVLTLDPALSRISIIQFSMPEGAFGVGERERVVVSLTSDIPTVLAGLDEILFFGPAGATDYGGAIGLLIGEFTTNGDPANRRQLCYMMSDGVPTYPDGGFGNEDPGDSQWALDQADIAASQGIVINTFGVGFIPSVTLDPVFPRRCVVGLAEVSTLECVALRTGGEFFASNDPEDIVDRLLLSRPAGIELVTATNLETGDSASTVPSPNGSFSLQLPLVQGVINNIEVVVLADDGTTCVLETNVLPMCFALSDGCSPLTQGYWHRQCEGVGLIDNGGIGPPPHPDWQAEALLRLMVAVVDPLIRELGSPTDTTTCQALDADPPDDMCQKAIKQYAAVLMNMYGGHLGPDCLLELPTLGIVTPQQAADAIKALIIQGLAGDPRACYLANDLADLINTGQAVR
jgi:hypothetical protein